MSPEALNPFTGQIESILKKFDEHKNKHVERIYHPIDGQACLF